MGWFSLFQESLNSIPEADVAAEDSLSIPALPVPTPFKQHFCLYILHCQGLSTITDQTSKSL